MEITCSTLIVYVEYKYERSPKESLLMKKRDIYTTFWYKDVMLIEWNDNRLHVTAECKVMRKNNFEYVTERRVRKQSINGNPREIFK